MSGTHYIATFFTHYDAVKFVRELHGRGLSTQLSPVPRRLSSSCGTCARFSCEGDPRAFYRDGIEQLAQIDGEAFIPIVDNR